MLIIGLSGKIGVGKDYLVDTFISKYQNSDLFGRSTTLYKLGFADLLKKEYNFIHSSDKNFDQLTLGEYRDRIKHFSEQKPLYYYPNKLYQKLLDYGDDEIVFVKDIRLHSHMDVIIRFDNKIIRINADDRNLEKLEKEYENNFVKIKLAQNHFTEVELDNYCFDYYINNSKKANGYETFERMVLEIIESSGYMKRGKKI